MVETDNGSVVDEAKIETVTYYDGLGRPKQSIGVGAGGDLEDLVTPVEYDSYGRQEKEYLPFAATSQKGQIYTDPITDVTNFYNTNKYENTTNPYSKKQLESSPLNRVLAEGAPGNQWALGSENEIEFSFEANGSNEVRMLSVSFTNGDYREPTLSDKGYYPAGTLYKAVVYDEEHDPSNKNHSTEEFKDKQGRVVLKRTYADFAGQTEVTHDTYYVYDDYGNLTYVLPPKMNATNNQLTSLLSNLDALGYQFEYDRRNRLVEKQMPGKGKEFIVYNQLDQPILTQDALQREKNIWLYTKYDALGRVTSTGKYSESNDYDQLGMQGVVTNFYQNSGKTPYEEKNGQVYTNRSFPDLNTTVLTENYYDDYNFNKTDIALPESNMYSIEIEASNLQGLATGSRVKVLGEDAWITSVSGYDDKGRLIWSSVKNDFLGTKDVVDSELDFVGNTLRQKTTHNKVNVIEAITTEDIFTYDHMNRMITHQQTINNGPLQLIAHNTYDELGQLKAKGVGSGIRTGRLEENTQTKFTNVSGLDVNELIGQLKRNGEVSYKGWNSGASTKNKLKENGFMEFSGTASKHYAIGLSYQNTDHTVESVDYCIRGYNDRTFRIFENGVDQGVHLTQKGYFKIVRENDTIKYYHNGELIYVSPNKVTGDLIGDIALYSSDCSATIINFQEEGDLENIFEGVYENISGVRIFDNSKMLKNTIDSQQSNLETFGTINNDGKISFRRRWSSAGISVYLKNTESERLYRMNVSSGTIKTGMNNSSSFTGNSGSTEDVLTIERENGKISFKVNDKEFTSIKTPSYGNLQAIANFSSMGSTIYDFKLDDLNDKVDYNKQTTFKNSSGIDVTEIGSLVRQENISSGIDCGISTIDKITGDGYIEFRGDSRRTSYIGLSRQDLDNTYQSIEYALRTHDDFVSVFEDGVEIGVTETWTSGYNIFRIERVGNKIHYQKDGITFYTSNKTSTGDLIGDISMYSQDSYIPFLQIIDNDLIVNIEEDEKFRDKIGLAIEQTGTIIKHSDKAWQGELASIKEIENNGFLSFSPYLNNSEFILGLSYSNSIAEPQKVNYGIHFKESGQASILQHGNYPGFDFSYTTNDFLKINKENNEVQILKNDELIYVFESLSFHPLIADISINTNGAGIKNLILEETFTNSGWLQKIDYTYNIRGWLKSINNPDNLGEDLFGFKIGYNDPEISGATALYNGNISETHWNSQSINSKGNPVSDQYIYGYDALNRIKSATDNTGNYNLSGIAYDKMGNILSLQRQGQTDASATLFGTMDNLVYNYTGNQLMKVTDSGNKDQGFKEPATSSGNDYGYDLNGNLTSDANKGIAAGGIEYNHLNMPTKITVSNAGSNNGVIDYVYTADGIKLQKKKTQAGVTTTTDYAGDFVYENNTLKQFYQPEGYVEPDGSGWQYVYQYRDIWGNTRITYADDDNNGSVTSSEIRREQNYYPFGLEHKGYNINSYGAKNNLKTYQGQEFTEDLGLNTHEWKYRMSDPSIGRFWQIDPLAEDYTYNSTYAFQENKLGSGIELEGLESTNFPYQVQREVTNLFSGLKSTINAGYENIKSKLSINLTVPKIEQKSGFQLRGKADGIGDPSGMFPESKNAKSDGSFDVQVLVDLADVYGPDLPKAAEAADIFSSFVRVLDENSGLENGNNTSVNESNSKTKQAPFSYFLRSFEAGNMSSIDKVHSNGTNTAENTLKNNPNIDSIQIIPFYIIQQGSYKDYEREKDTTITND
ncbi:MAG: DUF6443 domain-containing protein [Salegentibacter mishustinae]|nr:DUF6443 domain-containing protein [Salegentibacter mishustinae]